MSRFQTVERYIRSQDTRKYHTLEQKREALNELVSRAYQSGATNGKAIFHIPPQDDDADVILYQCIDELQEHSLGNVSAYVATIEGGSYGLRDFPDGRPGIWFGVKYGLYDAFGALVAFTSDAAEEFMVKNNIDDIRQINGRKCVIVDRGGIVHFIGMFNESNLA